MMGYCLRSSAVGLSKENLMFVARQRGYLEATLGSHSSSFQDSFQMVYLPVQNSTTHIFHLELRIHPGKHCLIFSFTRESGSKRMHDLLKVTQLIFDGVGVQTQLS